MEIKNPENFVSTIYHLETSPFTQVSTENQSAKKINEIKAELQEARTAFRKRKYEAAIYHYKKVRGIAYQLLHPSIKPGRLSVSDLVKLPVGVQIDQKMAEVSLLLLENIQPDIVKTTSMVWVGGAPLPPNVKMINEEGFQINQLNQGQLEEQITFGTELLSKGQVNQAIEVLSLAVKNLDKDSDNSVVATVHLNLSSAWLAAKNFKNALDLANKANEIYSSSKDYMGQAQTLHNIGTAQLNLGDHEKSRATLKSSSEMFETASKLAINGSTSMPIRENNQPFLTNTNTSLLQPVSNSASSFRLVTDLPLSVRPSTNPDKLNFISSKNTGKVSVRWLGDSSTWSGLVLDKIKTPVVKQQTWKVGVHANGTRIDLAWTPQKSPTVTDLINSVYVTRINASLIGQLKWYMDSEASTAVYLTHIYSYVTPVGIADAYHEMGNYQKAEEYYILASQYSYLNNKLEATNLWIKIANNVLAWGDELYKNEKVIAAVEIYSKLVTKIGEAPTDSLLFEPPIFNVPANVAINVIQNLQDHDAVTSNGAIASPIYTVWSRWQNILAGLDFYGLALTPIFTFEYLQQAAKGFALQAIQAEREYINFLAQFEAESATRRDLENSLTMSKAEIEIQKEHYEAAKDDAAAANHALNLANVRKQNAEEDMDNYRVAGYWQYISQSMATAMGAGQDWHGSEIRQLSSDIESGSAKGKSGKLAAAATLLGGQKSYEYQLDRMANQIQELNATIPIAEAQKSAAAHREEAARLYWKAAQTKHDLVEDALNAFDNEIFTPETWALMALVMRSISNSYQYWAVRTAKLMERAYNFETDHGIKIIKNSYGVNLGKLNDVFGADLLLKDIDSFTYHFITNTNSKDSKLKDILSLRNEYPFDFYQFQQTGLMKFETALHDFDRRHPGFYGQRLTAVEVEIIGLLPSDGVNGTLRGSFFSQYRSKNGSKKHRLHVTDTLALSEYTYRGDSIHFRMDLQKRGLFEGNGVSGSWELDLPRRSNNFDYRLITDVRLIFFYSARFDLALKTSVLNRAPLLGEMIHVRDFALRYDFPEVWYSFLKTGQMTMNVTANMMPRNETAFKTEKTAIKLIAAEGISAENVKISLNLPGKNPFDMTTGADGSIEAKENNALVQAMGGDLLGEWQLSLELPADSDLLTDGKLDSAKLLNISLINQYEFDWA